MSSSKKTPYYNLSQFQDADKPSWRGDYNGDMDKIDTGIRDAKDTAIEARRTANEMDAKIEEVKNTYVSKVNADEKYATKTLVSDTKNEIETNANNTFVTKSVYNENIAQKADKTSVYTKSESDEKFALKTANNETQSQLDALAALTRPLTSWAAYSHPTNSEQKSISSSSPSTRMLYPTAEKPNDKYVEYNNANGTFTFHEGSYLILAHGRFQNVKWSDSTSRMLRAQFTGPHGDIMFDDCKAAAGDNQLYSMWGLLRVAKNETVNATMNASFWTPPSGVNASFKVEEASIAIILLQSETYDE